MTACLQCGEPLGPNGTCDTCSGSLTFVERELRRLRNEIVQDASGESLPSMEATVPTSWAPEPTERGQGRAPAPSRAVADPTGKPREIPPDGLDGDSPGSPTDTSTAGGPSVAREPSGSAKDIDRGWSGAASLRARELDVTTPEGAREALAEVLDHQRRGRGKVIGVAGLPRHGKTKLADRLRERAVERPGVDLRYDKTSRGRVNVYYVPGRRDHHVLIDVAGEDFQLLGDYSRELPALMSEFLWPVLQRLDGLVLLLALPIVWAGWNRPDVDQRQDPDPTLREEMRLATTAMVDAHRTLLKYALVARNLNRIPRLRRRFGIRAEQAPTRRQIDDVYQATPRLSYPVFLGFSKADLYPTSEGRSGLYSPPPPGGDTGSPALHPLRTDPLAVGRIHFPELFDFLLARVRHFKFDFVQALEDDTDRPDPGEARVPDAPIETLLGGESALAFLTGHPWRFPGISTRAALTLDRWLRRGRWDAAALEALAGTDPWEAP